MSASPLQPPDQPDLWADDAKSAPIGFAMMMSRRLLSPNKPPLLEILIQAIAASGVSVLVGWGIDEHIQSVKLKYALVGLAGAFAPEVIAFAYKYLQARFNQEVKKVTPNAPRKGKAKRRGR